MVDIWVHLYNLPIPLCDSFRLFSLFGFVASVWVRWLSPLFSLGYCRPGPTWRLQSRVFRFGFVNCNSRIGLIWELLQTILNVWETYSTVTPDTPKVGIRRAHPRILFLLRRYVDPYTDSAIARIDSHSPDESAKAGRTIFMGSPKSFSASAASVALISCRREGTSAGLD